MRNALTRAVLLALVVGLGAAGALARAGENHRHTLLRGDSILRLEISRQFDPAAREQLQEWITFIADSLLSVYGRWPRSTWAISVLPAPASGSDPIPWAVVRRDEVDRVEFFIATHASAGELKQAWTGYHELAHLLIPYRGWGDLWFSEGMASYYQNILMARSGILNEQQFWQKLYEGFRRGKADSAFDGLPLWQVSDEVRRKGGFMRVYWSGAWYFLAADIRLRRQSQGSLTLDRALEKLNACCADQAMSVEQIVAALDELNGVLIFAPLYEKLRQSTEVPAFNKLFASVGVRVEDDRVVLQEAGPGASLRRQMFPQREL